MPMHDSDNEQRPSGARSIALMLLVVALVFAFAPQVEAHVATSSQGCLHVGTGLNGNVIAKINGHTSTHFGSYAWTKVIDNFGSSACGHVGEEPDNYHPGARWKAYRNGTFCSQSSLIYTANPQNTIAIGWQYPYTERCGGGGAVWSDRACGAIQSFISEKCPSNTVVGHSL